MKGNNPAPAVGNADKLSNSSIVSSCEQTRSNALSSTSTTAYNTEKDQKDENDLDEGTTKKVGSKGSDEVAINHKPKNVCYGITNLESKGYSACGPVDGTGSKGSGIVSSN